jgi:hypothetical protein
VRQTVVFEIDQHATAQIDDERDAVLMRELSEVGFGHRRGEPLNRVIAGVHLHDGGGARGERFGEILEMRAVGGADFDQFDAGALHDVGDAKRAADFDQLAARHQHFLFAALRAQRVECEIHRGGVVVDHHRAVAAGEPRDPFFDVRVAFAARAAIQIEFEIDRACHCHHYRIGH